jgi:subtilisin-like proprotein convertase family protein
MSKGIRCKAGNGVSSKVDSIFPNESLHVNRLALRKMPVQVRYRPYAFLTSLPLVNAATKKRQVCLRVDIDHEYSLAIILGQ